MTRVDMPAPPLPPGRPRLVVTGFMGTGKTTAGRLAAERLGMPFVDLDEVAERRLGAPVAEVFRAEGEGRFREAERRLLREAANLSGTVVATGGGAVMAPEFATLARGAEVAVLTAMTEDIEARLGEATARPLLSPDPRLRIQELLDARSSAYSDAGEALSTTDRSPDQVADDLAARYRGRVDPSEPVTVEVRASGHGPVLVGEGVIGRCGEAVAERLPEARTAALVVDPAAAATAEEARGSVERAGLRTERIDLPSGEAAKTHDVVGWLWSAHRDRGVEPSDVVVAVGGGAALDAAGFAAATYARGVAVVNVPTTLLAMVDAGLGGKTAIDHAGAKNVAGAFHPPATVLADPAALRGLPDEELRSGMAEVVKAAALASPLLFDLLDAGPRSWIVEQAVRVKAAYVAADPLDRGARRSLNLGHTFGHAIEAVTGYGVRHGEAVAAGLVAAARLGAQHGVTDPDVEPRLIASLERLGLPTAPPRGLDPGALIAAMGADKKRRSGRQAFVVPIEGGAALLEDVDPAEAVRCLLPEDARR